MLNQEQLKQRRSGIGGSDVAAILGISPWKTPLQVYMEKRGELEPQEGNRFAKWGSALEPLIREEYESQTGSKVIVPNELQRHPQYDYMIANLDGVTLTDLGELKVVEIKTAMQFKAHDWGDENTDELPEYYLTQVHHYMTVIDAPEADVAVLIGGNDFRIYNVKRDLEISEMLIERERQFWQMVQDGTVPDLQTTQDWQLRFADKINDNLIEADSSSINFMLELQRVQSQINDLKNRKDSLKVKLMQDLKNNNGFCMNGKPVGKIIQATRKSTDVELIARDYSVDLSKYQKSTTSTFFKITNPKILRGI